LGERFSASKFWDEIRKYNAVEFNTLGAMIPILLKQPEKPDDKDNPVRVVLSAACPAWAWRPFEERFGVKIIEWFGMVDAPGYFINKDGKVGSMGKPCGNLEVKIVDDNDNELPSGKIGELVFRIKDLPQSETPTSYWEMPEKTYEAYGNGWFHTGDLAYKDEEGYFYFAGRKKEAIRVKGENVSAWEVENVINRHPKVLESAAIAVPSELGEDELKVIVVLREGEKMTPEELLDYCQDNMAYFKIPRYVEFRSFIPKTGTHRIRYAELKKEGITSNTWDREKAGYRIRAKEQLKEKLLKA
jgi:crotonobetaine/carnitine-CoA ligase